MTRMRRATVGALVAALAWPLLGWAAPTLAGPTQATTITGWSQEPLRAAVGYLVRDDISVSAGTATGARAFQVQERGASDDTWRTTSTGTTRSDGTISAQYTVPATGLWRIRVLVPATATAARAVTTAREIRGVKGLPTRISGWRTSTLRPQPAASVGIRFTVRTGDEIKARAAVLQRRRVPAGGVAGEWRRARGFRTASAGATRLTFTAPKSGEWSYRVLVPATKTASQTSSATRGVSVISDQTTPVLDLSSVPQMFTDAESQDTILSAAREFNINRAVRVRPVSPTKIEIANFAPATLKNITVWMSIAGGPSRVAVVKVSTLLGHGITTISYPFLSGNHRALNASGAEVDMSAYSAGVPVNSAAFDFSASSGPAKLLADLDSWDWRVKFVDYNPQNNPGTNWQSGITPRQARLYTALLFDFAAGWNAPGFEDRIVATSLHDNAQVELTAAQKRQVFKDLHSQTMNAGICVNVSGLGGGSVLGLHDYIVNWFLHLFPGGRYEQKPIFREDIFPHEVGHKLGFSHDSNLTYEDATGGFVVASGEQMHEAWNRGLLPITRENYLAPADWKFD